MSTPLNTIKRSDFEKICRICLHFECNMISINKPEILEMFQSCTTIMINNNDELPSQICSNCFSKMIESYNFKQLCENSNQLLLEILNKELNDSALITESDINIKSEVLIKDEKYDNDIDTSNDNVNDGENEWPEDDSSSIENQIQLQLEPTKCDKKKLRCTMCNRSFSSVVSLERHLKTHNFLCNICNKRFVQKSSLVQHLKRHDRNTKYACEQCELTFVEINSLASHVAKKHNPDPILCSVCNKKFILQLQVDAHMKVHSEKNYLCPVCGKGFYKQYLVHRHQKHHATERNYHCLQCDKSFRVKATLRAHYRCCHTGEKKREVCTICGKAVLNIKAHLKTHVTEKTFKCADCPKAFAHKYNLEEHRKRRHGNPEETKRPYLCSICGKGSVSTTALKNHYLHMHTDDKTYPCPICNKKFKSNNAINLHVRYTHNDDRRHKCTVCSKSFHTNEKLRIHTRTHTGERPFVCQLCSKAFGRASTLKTHMKVHGLESEKNNKIVSKPNDTFTEQKPSDLEMYFVPL